jgi:hypothetical protein
VEEVPSVRNPLAWSGSGGRTPALSFDERDAASASAGTSRRTVLTRGLYAIVGAGIAGTAFLSGHDATRSTAAASSATADSGAKAASAGRALAMSMFVRDVRFTTPGLKPGKLPDFSSTMSPKGRLESPTGDHLGKFSSGILPGSDGHVAVQRFTFSDGSLIGMGSGHLDGEEYAVVGGTGRFAGAIGSYSVTLQPGRSGRDAEFAISLTGMKG